MSVPNFSFLACLEVARLVRLARLANFFFNFIDFIKKNNSRLQATMDKVQFVATEQ